LNKSKLPSLSRELSTLRLYWWYSDNIRLYIILLIV